MLCVKVCADAVHEKMSSVQSEQDTPLSSQNVGPLDYCLESALKGAYSKRKVRSLALTKNENYGGGTVFRTGLFEDSVRSWSF